MNDDEPAQTGNTDLPPSLDGGDLVLEDVCFGGHGWWSSVAGMDERAGKRVHRVFKAKLFLHVHPVISESGAISLTACDSSVHAEKTAFILRRYSTTRHALSHSITWNKSLVFKDALTRLHSQLALLHQIIQNLDRPHQLLRNTLIPLLRPLPPTISNRFRYVCVMVSNSIASYIRPPTPQIPDTRIKKDSPVSNPIRSCSSNGPIAV